MKLASRALAALTTTVLLLASACGGDDDDDVAAIDAAAGIDGTSVDAPPATACSDPGDCTDPLHSVCDTAAGVCVQCLDTGDCESFFFSHVCDTDQKECVECLATTDCTNDPTALGPTCNLGLSYCQCAGDEECADNPNGKVCDPDKDACSCVGNTDCVEPATCQDSFYLGEGKKTCQMPK